MKDTSLGARCSQCDKHKYKLQYIKGASVCPECNMENEALAKTVTIDTNDAIYWEAYRRHLGLDYKTMR